MAITMCGCTSADERNGNHSCPNPQATFEGAVLDTYEENGYDDSDFFAVVWDGEKVRPVPYASTRGWTYHNGASVDATPETEAAALAWYRARWEAGEIERQTDEAARPRKGRRVRSTTTRGKNVGVEGEIGWVGPVETDWYGRTDRDAQRFGVRVAGERGYRFLPAKSLEVVAPQPVDVDAIKATATEVRPANWRSALYVSFPSRILDRMA